MSLGVCWANWTERMTRLAASGWTVVGRVPGVGGVREAGQPGCQRFVVDGHADVDEEPLGVAHVLPWIRHRTRQLGQLGGRARSARAFAMPPGERGEVARPVLHQPRPAAHRRHDERVGGELLQKRVVVVGRGALTGVAFVAGSGELLEAERADGLEQREPGDRTVGPWLDDHERLRRCALQEVNDGGSGIEPDDRLGCRRVERAIERGQPSQRGLLIVLQ